MPDLMWMFLVNNADTVTLSLLSWNQYSSFRKEKVRVQWKYIILGHWREEDEWEFSGRNNTGI